MKNKKVFLVVTILIVSIIIVGWLLINKKDNINSDKIPDGYIAVFHGGSGELTRETYIYKKKNEPVNSGFEYINVTSVTTSWGSGQWSSKITKKGSVQWTDDVFSVAKDNDAYSYVTLPNSTKTYTIEEYMGMFLMN